MSTLTQRYASQCMAGAGFAIMDSRLAWQLRPDLWASAQDCALSGGWKQDMPGASRMQADIEGLGLVAVLTRSADNLAQRIEWVTGAKVKDVQEAPAAEDQPKASSQSWQEHAKRAADEKLARLRELAAQEPPSHDCHVRREILRARNELAAIGTFK